MMRWSKLFNMDFNWKDIVRKVMDSYIDKAEGSRLEFKESGVVWKYSDVNEDYYKKVVDELILHLKTVLGYIKEIEVIRGRFYVEDRPFRINKLRVLLNLLKFKRFCRKNLLK